MSIINTFRLDGKTALVTGCKRGIGKGIAIGLAEAGADIIGVSASLEAKDSAVEKEIRALGRNFKAYKCDFANRKSLYSFIEKVKIDFPVIDILFNNAGTIH
jgi:2-deoxy-D-gluconate 3-dehydrogenase